MCILRLQSYYSYIFFTKVVVETIETIILLCFTVFQTVSSYLAPRDKYLQTSYSSPHPFGSFIWDKYFKLEKNDSIISAYCKKLFTKEYIYLHELFFYNHYKDFIFSVFTKELVDYKMYAKILAPYFIKVNKRKTKLIKTVCIKTYFPFIIIIIVFKHL